MKKHMLYVLLSLVLLEGGLCAEQRMPQSVPAAAEQTVRQQVLQQLRTEQAGVLALESEWERCKKYTYRIRRFGGLSKTNRGELLIDCKPVITRCNAIDKEENLFVPSACFYAAKDKDEVIKFKKAFLYTRQGKIVLTHFSALKDFVLFSLAK